MFIDWFRNVGTLLLAIAVSASAMKKEQVEVCVVQVLTPRYPPIARQARIEGEVRVEVELASDGVSKHVKPISGHPLLRQVVDDAVRVWKFECSSGKCPDGLTIPIAVEFKLLKEERYRDCPRVTVYQPPIRVVVESHRVPINIHSLVPTGL